MSVGLAPSRKKSQNLSYIAEDRRMSLALQHRKQCSSQKRQFTPASLWSVLENGACGTNHFLSSWQICKNISQAGEKMKMKQRPALQMFFVSLDIVKRMVESIDRSFFNDWIFPPFHINFHHILNNVTHGIDLCSSLPYLRLFCYPDHCISCRSDRHKLGMLNVNLLCFSNCFSYSSLLLGLLTLYFFLTRLPW